MLHVFVVIVMMRMSGTPGRLPNPARAREPEPAEPDLPVTAGPSRVIPTLFGFGGPVGGRSAAAVPSADDRDDATAGVVPLREMEAPYGD